MQEEARAWMLREIGLQPLWGLREQRVGPALPTVVAQEDAPDESEPNANVGEVASLNPVPEAQVAQAAESSDPDPTAWQELLQNIVECRRCELCKQRKQVVPGVGDLEPDWLFIGEGPGVEEDARGEPFVGQAGQLLDNMLASLDLKRNEKIYITNAVKCRPPGNRTPDAEEIAACRPFLAHQISLLRPKIIMLLGKSAVSSLLNTDGALGKLRSQCFEYEGIPVVVSYHPAYLLRNLPEKIKAWEDLLYARRILARDPS